MSRRAWLIAVTAFVAFGLGVVALLRSVAPQPPAPARQMMASAPTKVTSHAKAAASATSESPPPWANATDAVAPEAPSADPTRERRIRELRQSVQGLVAEASQRSDASYAHLSKALDTLEAMDDPAVKARINIPAVRQNLEISMKMQALTRELQQVYAQPQSPARDAQVASISERFRALQAQLRTDVQAGASIAAAPAPEAAQ